MLPEGPPPGLRPGDGARDPPPGAEAAEGSLPPEARGLGTVPYTPAHAGPVDLGEESAAAYGTVPSPGEPWCKNLHTMSRLPEEARHHRPEVSHIAHGPSAIDSSPLEEATRMAAYVKACEGISTPLLEQGFIIRLVAACLHVEDRRVREVLNALEESARQRRNKPGH